MSQIPPPQRNWTRRHLDWGGPRNRRNAILGNVKYEGLSGSATSLERSDPSGTSGQVPADAADLMTKLCETDKTAAAEVLVWLMSTTMAYGGQGRYEEAKARDIVTTLTRLLGHGARWWTNVSSFRFTPARSLESGNRALDGRRRGRSGQWRHRDDPGR